MIKKILKGNKGISIMDVGVALTLFAIFAGLVGNLYYQIAYNRARIRYDGIAVYSIVRLAEYIDELPYDDNFLKIGTNETSVTRTNEEVKSHLNYPDYLNITVTISKYTKENEEVEDLIKIINIEVKYKILETESSNNDFSFSIKKLKIKEANE